MKVMAHRGDSGSCPENTIIAFEKAITKMADGIELDIHLSKDGEIFVCHDERVDRTTDGRGYIKDLTNNELEKLDAGSWFSPQFKGVKLPTLKEVFNIMKNNDLLINIELKAGSRYYKNIEQKVVSLVYEYGYNKRVIFSSFDHKCLVTLKNLAPEIKTGILYAAALIEPWEYAKKIKADALHPNFLTVDQELIIGAKRSGLLLNPYTVNDEHTIKQLATTQGIDYIITNYPDKAKKIILRDKYNEK